jgi:hypothetical protein
MTVEGSPGSNPDNVIYTDAGVTTANSFARIVRVRNMTLRKSSADRVHMLDANTTVSHFSGENLKFTSVGDVPANGAIVWRYNSTYMESCSMPRRLAGASKVIGCSGDFVGPGVAAVVGTRTFNSQINPGTADDADGLFVGWNFISASTPDNLTVLTVIPSTAAKGIALIGNVFERYNGGGGPAVNINGDGNTQTSENINIIGNTVQGGRCNISYTDAGGSTRRDHTTVMRFNIFNAKNHKAGDFFAYEGEVTSPVRVGNWGIRYGVSARSNTTLTGESRSSPPGVAYYPRSWFGDILPVGSTTGTADVPLGITFADNQAAGEGNAGQGDYTPVITTDLATIPAGLTPWPVDLLGRAIATDGSAFAGAVQKA